MPAVARATFSSLLFTCAVLPPRELRVGALPFLKWRGMGTEKRVSNLKAKKSVECTKQSEGLVKSCKEVESLRDNPSRLEAMTVRELRTVMRSVGIPTEGSKQDLVSALGCFLLKQENDNGDQGSPLASKDIPSAVNSTPAKDKPLKRKSQNSAVKNNTQTLSSASEIPENKQKKNKGKSQLSQSSCFEDGSGASLTEQKLSVRTEEILDVKRSRSRRKVSSETSVQQGSLPVNSDEPWTVLAHKKPQQGWVPYNPKTMRPPPLADGTKIVKLMSWNVNGLKALLKLEDFSALELAKRENFDVLCLQETKIQEKDVDEIKERLIHGYDNSFWTCSVSKLGYSGTAVISRIKPISVRYGLGIQDHDSEGRLVTVEFDTFYLLSGYVPNSGEGLKRLTYRVTEWDPSLSNYIKDLEKSKPVILTGDLNCAHEEIDIFNPAGNRRSAGFTIEERESFEKNFLSKGFVDTFRKQHPGVVGYTYWGYRHGGRKANKGWRLDYFLVSESIADKVHDSYILPDVPGSDHCPIGLILKI